MTKIISFISRKGGTGKTTNAAHLAGMIHSLGHKVVLVETDTNYTLSTLRKMELFKSGAKETGLYPILGSEDSQLAEELPLVAKKHQPDYIVVDSAGKTTDEHIKALALQSRLVVVPTSLTQNDLLVTYQTVEDIRPAREHNPELKVVVLPNRIHTATKMETIHASLSELDALVLEHRVPQKNLFANFSTLLPEKEYLSIAKSLLAIAD